MLFVYLTICFFLGSFPSAHIVSSIQGVDIKKTGSGNAGAIPFAISRIMTISPDFQPTDLRTLVAPAFPLPVFLISTPWIEETICALGNEPKKKQIVKYTKSIYSRYSFSFFLSDRISNSTCTPFN
jgi:hypothetical protein